MQRKGPTKALVFVAMTSNQHNILYSAERCSILRLQTLYARVLIKSKKCLKVHAKLRKDTAHQIFSTSYLKTFRCLIRGNRCENKAVVIFCSRYICVKQVKQIDYLFQENESKP